MTLKQGKTIGGKLRATSEKIGPDMIGFETGNEALKTVFRVYRVLRFQM